MRIVFVVRDSLSFTQRDVFSDYRPVFFFFIGFRIHYANILCGFLIISVLQLFLNFRQRVVVCIESLKPEYYHKHINHNLLFALTNRL